MITYVMSVRDICVDSFGQPFFALKLEQAKRNFGDEVNRVSQDNKFNLHPEHFELFHLGMFDDEAATFNLFERPRQIVLGSDLVRK